MSTEILFMCGTGGVGKTTTSVAVAFEKVRQGSRCLLLTIDPAQRLADALHLSISPNIPHPIDLHPFIQQEGVPDFTNTNGALWAMTLDAPSAFAGYTERFSPPETWSKLQNNRYYQFAAQRMGGIQEMMAVLLLVDMVETKHYDCIVVDTPPAQNVHAFFTAPTRISELFSKSGLQWLTSTEYGFSSRSFSKSIVSKGLGYFLGAETMTEISEFFRLFHTVAQALERSANHCSLLFKAPTTQYWLVQVPNRPLAQLTQFEEWLRTHHHIDGRIFNRVHPPLPVILNTDDRIYAEPLLSEIERYNEEQTVNQSAYLPKELFSTTHSTNHSINQWLAHTTPEVLETLEGIWIWSQTLRGLGRIPHPQSE